jgi:hypothetical protein
LHHYAEHFDAAPPIVNLVESPALARRDLVTRLRRARPDLKVLWMPFPVLRVLSLMLTVLQKLLRPSTPALNLYSAFKSEPYDDSVVRQMNLRPPFAPGVPA